MKRRSIDGSDGGGPPIAAEEANKKQKSEKGADAEEEVVAADLGEDLVFEVLKRADARTLAAAACVSRRWRMLAGDERLWEAVCVRHWASIGCGNQQLRSVVLALGGFRRLHSLYLLPLLKPSLRRPAALPSLPLPATAGGGGGGGGRPVRWGKDEVQLSLSLFSIGYFEKMNPNCKRGGGGS
ncbi:F-box protein GID2-like [Elaeis guineensis]|uniref:F-box protein GID2 n=1 Tax=Elaeis guineensis var. tenera TaxID=51953 RepID=A0A8N4IFA1_ELAGV|nr:F-box protein GID2-like [Elaeis guineensis]